MSKIKTISEDQLDLLHIIENDSKVSQRVISHNSGFSIGKVNYCVSTHMALCNIKFMIS